VNARQLILIISAVISMTTAIRSPLHTARILVPALAIVLVLGVGKAAQAACYDSGQQLPERVVSQFINEPGKLLTQFPSGGPQMISLIRDLVASDPGTLPLITELNAKANADQVQAIGTGLGQAALVCARPAQAFSDEIQRVTIAANNKPMTQAFGAVMGDQFLGLAGPAVGGGGAGATGQIGSTGGTTVAGVSLNLTTSVSNIASTTSFGFTPSAAVSGGSGSQGGSALAGSPGSSTLGANPGSLVSAGSPGGSALAGSPGGAALVQSVRGSLFAGNPSGSNSGAGSNISGGTSILAGANTLSFTANIAANINSPISVSPSLPR
jgi:hypothetical protein